MVQSKVSRGCIARVVSAQAASMLHRGVSLDGCSLGECIVTNGGILVRGIMTKVECFLRMRIVSP